MTDSVLFVSTQMEAGGVQVRSTSMQRALLGEGVQTDLVFLYKKRPVFEENDRLQTLLSRPPAGIGDYLEVLKRLWTLMQSRRPSAVVGFAHYSSPLACIFGLFAGVRRRIATQTNPPTTMPKLARWIDFICGATGVYTHNVAASHSVLDAFDSYPKSYRKRLSVVYNGISSEVSSLTSVTARQSFGLPTDASLIVACGRLSHQKNHAFLLRVMVELPDCRLAILGDGELRESLREQAISLRIAERVTFVGEVHPARVKDFLRCGDVFAFPSHYEAFGLAVVEAMMSGLPVISSDHAALREVVGEAGLLLPLDDPKVWASAIRSVLNDGERRLAMSEASRRQASKFNFESMLKGFRTLLLDNPNHTVGERPGTAI